MAEKYSIPLGNYQGTDPIHCSVYGAKVNENPLYFLSPALEADFLPTRVAQLLFIGKNYDPWPPAGLQDSLDRIELLFPLFPRFRIHLWVDLSLAAQIEADVPAPGYEALMQIVSDNVEAMCATYAPFGFVFEGDPGGSVPTTRIDEIIADMLADA
jgi:hypothetical protein